MTLELHIFSNSTINSPKTDIIERTYSSFCKIFNTQIIPTLWVDPNPNTTRAAEYIKNLRKAFPSSTINQTESLSDGYISAIKQSTHEFLFMLEHDWLFRPSIEHSLDEIMAAMNKQDLIHLRFNKRKNIAAVLDRYLTEETVLLENNKMFHFCRTPSFSNNPHIIHRQRYLDSVFKFIKKEKGPFGIEDYLQFFQQQENFEAAIYGELNKTATIYHQDGRKMWGFASNNLLENAYLSKSQKQ